MTDKQKVKHAIAVLRELERRAGSEVITSHSRLGKSLYGNLKSLRELLMKKHVTNLKKSTKDIGRVPWALADRLLTHILGRKPNFRQVDIDKWAVEMSKIMRLDKRTEQELIDIIDWCQQDDFWQDNILSPSKLRLQLDKLEFKMQKDKQWLRHRQLRPAQAAYGTDKTAKQRYLEKLNEEDSGDDD